MYFNAATIARGNFKFLKLRTTIFVLIQNVATFE